MNESLLSIGAFARAAGLSASALRFYDEVELLPAAHVDPASGYRFYDQAQQDQARLLAILRTAEIPVETMRSVLALDPDARAARLVELAGDIMATATARAQQLRDIAGHGSDLGVASGTVDGRQAADALTRVASVTGVAPFDGVLLEVREGELAVLATDRYRLARFVLATSETRGSGRCLLGRDQWPLVRDAFASAGLGAHVSLDGELLYVGEAEFHVRTATGFADLWALHACFDAEAGQTLAWPEAASGDQVDLGQDVALGGTLARGAVASLLGGPVVARGSGPGQPVMLGCAGQPAHSIAIMSLARG